MDLPSDASSDQSNVPTGYYRRNTGMLHMLSAQSPAFTPQNLTDDELRALDGMSREDLIALVQRMARQCGMVAAMSEEQTAQAMFDTLAHTALRPIAEGGNMRADITARMTAIDKWLDRTRGKPAQYIHQVNENITKTSAHELTNEQLMIELRKLSASNKLPDNVLLLEDGTLTIDN